MTEVISVRFRGGCKNYYFDPKGLQVKMGDQVIVETAQGPEFATCTQGNHEVEDSAIVSPLCAVLRMATENDRRTVEYNKKKESEAFDICEKKIGEHGLEMKLVNVSTSFDGNKIIFYFTADGRVDFRELVRDLASVFRARIELRQIGVRDEAKMIGGLGICGRPFCCSQFLDSFMPVSIKMAKTQNLSLNPTKISGTCGRLMCCLKYEQNAYEDAAKRMPKAESFVQTPDGPGNVKSVDLLRETMKVSLDSAAPNEPLKTYRNCEVCVLRNGKGSRDGIEIPDRPARYVEEKEEELFAAPILTTPFYMDKELEEAPIREKIGGAESGEGGKSRRRHRGGRRGKGGSKSASGETQQPKTENKSAKSEGKKEKQQPKGGEEKKQGGKPRSGKQGGKAENKQAKPAPAPKAENKGAESGESGEAKKRRRPHHRGGRRRNKGGSGEGGAPKSE
ncbi:MAG: stage 0 sporulation family protein [Oscillibacter sp.]|nr:stage 0 sporulation family protein [Oscillibacter sp.]